jgi:heat shock protein HslJ
VYSASYVSDGSSLQIDSIGTSQMSCPQPVLTQESQYLDALAAAERYEVQGDRLLIYHSGNQVLAYSILSGTSWVLQSYGDPVAPTPVLESAQITARFAEDGSSVSGSAGCNDYLAPASISTTGIKMGPTSKTTMMMCAADVMTQEDAYLNALTTAQTYQVQGNMLRILYDGSQILSFVSQGTSP